jgi:membrane-associated protein
MLDYFLHLDDKLGHLIHQYGAWVYLILFIVVFCETGLVVTPFLPGDSLLFAAGVFAQGDGGKLNLGLLYLTFIAAALAGDNVNYFVGRFLGKKLFRNPKSRIFRKESLDKTHAFYERYGAKTIILARFVAIVRTFAPFVAGMGTMTYALFLRYCIVAASIWVGVCVTAGYLFGKLPAIKENFALAIVGIVLVPVVPIGVEWLRHRLRAKAAASKKSEAA